MRQKIKIKKLIKIVAVILLTDIAMFAEFFKVPKKHSFSFILVSIKV